MNAYDCMIFAVRLPSSPRREELVAAMFDLVAERGLDALSVREVARACGVSIGTVQHYFATKDDMLVAAYAGVVVRVRARIAAVGLGDDVRQNLARVLTELLPLDQERRAEARVQLAFSARAAVTPGLAAVQRDLLEEIIGELAEAFQALGQSVATARTSARLALAATDGLAQHAVSTGELGEHEQTAALARLLDHIC